MEKGIDLILASIGLMTPVFLGFTLFIMKQLTDLKKELAKICERMTREETKSDIYHSSDKNL